MKNLLSLVSQKDNVSKVSPNRDSLSQAKSLQSAIRSATEQKDIHFAYKYLFDSLSDLTSNPDFDGYFQDPSTRTYFFEGFLPEIVSFITSLEEIHRNDINDILNSCLRQILRLWAKFLFVDGTGSLQDVGKGWVFVNKLNFLLKYTLKKDILRLEDLQLLWKVIKENEAVQVALSEGFSQSQNNDLKADFVEYMILQFSENSTKKTMISGFELVSVIFKKCTMSDQLLFKYMDFSWRILSNHSVYSNMPEIFINQIKALVEEEKLTENNKLQLLYDCTRNIEKEELTLVSFKVIRTLLESYPLIANNENKLTRSECICHLCEKQGLLSKVIKDIKFLDKLKTDNKNPHFLSLKAEIKSELIKFIIYLTTQFPGCGRIITYEVLSSLWKIILVCKIEKDWYSQIAKLFVQIIESINSIDIKSESLERLLNEDMNPERCPSVLKITQQGFKCIRSVVVALNESLENISEVDLLIRGNNDVSSRFQRLKISDDSRLEEDGDLHFQVDVAPRKIIGYKTLWELALRVEDEKVAAKARDLLVSLHANLNPKLHFTVKEIRTEYLEQCFHYLKDETEQQLVKQRSLNLVHAIIDEIDKDFLKRPKLHCELSKGTELDLTVALEINSMTYIPHQLKVHSNMLVSDFLTELRHQSNMYPQNIYFEKKNYSSKQTISDVHYMRTLQSLGIKDQDELLAKIRELPEAFLIQYDSTLNPKVREIFTRWFEDYSDNGKMSPEQCSTFIHSCTNDMCNPNDKRTRGLFAEHDDDKDGYLTLEDFLSFYRTQCLLHPFVVWRNLYAHGITSNLKLPKDTIKKELNPSSLHMTLLINSNHNYIQLLFSLFESEDEIATTAFELLNRLPTNPQIFADIVLLKGVRDISDNKNRDWNQILDRKNLYRLSYSLSMVEYLLDPNRPENDDNEDMKALWNQESAPSEYKKTWTSDFLTLGGFEHLSHILNELIMLKSTAIVGSCLERIKSILSSCS